MNRFCSIFSQLLQLFPRWEFQQLVLETKAERHARGFSSWGQFVAMLFCQLGRAHSLREICGGLASCEGKLHHLGIASPKRSTLSYANKHRPWQLYEKVFYRLLDRCLRETEGRRKRRFRFKNPLLSLDATVIDLCAQLFDWAHFCRTKGAVKLHLLLDHNGYLPVFAHITEAATADITVARRLKFAAGTVVVFDRGYNDYNWYADLTRQGVFFVTRLKDRADYEVLEDRPLPKNRRVVRDQVIFLSRTGRPGQNLFLAPGRNPRSALWPPRFFDESPGFRSHHHCRNLQGALADRALFQGPQAESTGQDLRRHLGQRPQDPNLDSIDRSADSEVSAAQSNL